jgi:hypothetical protein
VFVQGGRTTANYFTARDVELSVNSGEGRIDGILYLRLNQCDDPSQNVMLLFKGTLNDISNAFSGTLSDFDHPDTGYKGTFRGALYGPRRDELGLVLRFTSITDPSDAYTGYMLSKRLYPCGSACSTSGAP